MSIHRVLVANRGEIAVRIVQACRALGLESVAAVSAPDRDSKAAQLADRVVCIGPPKPSDSYLNKNALLTTALATGADAIHPGYGFLSENAAFAEACEKEDLTFVGPRSETVRTMGNKLAAREAAQRFGVPLVPGTQHIAAFADAETAAQRIGYPVLFKAAAGGGGRGIRIVRSPAELEPAFRSASAEAAAAFGDPTLYLERYVTTGRHIEVQVIGDRHGRLLHLGERDCSLQRRYQKVLEEAPASAVSEDARAAIRRSAVRLAEGIGYVNAGTVEFLYDEERDEHYFLEMNTRIQVEHPVTEMITGLDLVQLQLQVAAGAPLPLTQEQVTLTGHAIECRINAEHAEQDFRPSPGRISQWEAPQGPDVRLDTHCYPGYVVPPFYDSLLGKLIVHGSDRTEALARMRSALHNFEVQGVATTIGFHQWLLDRPEVQTAQFSTRWLEDRITDFHSIATTAAPSATRARE